MTLSLSEFILPEQLYPWLNLASGVMVLAIGLYAIRDRLRRWLGGRVRPEDLEAHGHGHAHGAAGHGHDHGHGARPRARPRRTTTRRPRPPHGGHGHSHAPPDDLSWRSLIALGVSGGLIPCPSALVVLLSAIALHQVAFGMALIVAFSLGLAVVISGIGLTVHLRPAAVPAPAGRPRPLRRRAARGERRDHHDPRPALTLRSLPGVL